MKTVLITGASTGIGKATAKYFQAKGWQVAATMRDPDKGLDLAALPNVKVISLDVIDKQSVKSAVKQTVETFNSIEAVINNAGFSLIGPFETTPDDEIRRQYETNVFGLMNVVREILPIFRKNKAGTIVNIASIGGQAGFPLYSLYNSTKFAVEGFSEALQWELDAYNIRVKIIEPGVIKTDFYGRSMKDTRTKDSPYADFADQAIEKLMAMEKNGIQAEKVASTIFKAVSRKGKRMRYPVGGDAKSYIFLKRIFPFRLIRRILKGVIGI